MYFGFLSGYFFVDEGLDYIAFFDVVILIESDAALITLGDLFRVVLETFERVKNTFVNNYIVADKAYVRIARDLALFYGFF